MRSKKFWIPVICSLIVTPVALLLGIGSAGVGHGDYFAAMLLFPYTMLSVVAFDSIPLPFILLAVAQFPAYGIGLGYANERGRLARTAVILAAIHVTAAVAILLLAQTSLT